MATGVSLSGITANGGVGEITVRWLVTQAGCLPYTSLQKVEVYRGTSSSFATAVKAGESAGLSFIDSGLEPETRRYYWVRPVDQAGGEGNFAGPVNAITSDQAPPDNSVGEDQLQSGAVTTTKIANAAITNAKIANVDADKINANMLSAISANLGTVNAGTFRTATSGMRVEISDSTNDIRAYVGGSMIARLGGNQADGARISATSSNTCAVFSSSGGAALATNGRISALGSGGLAIYGEGTAFSANSHGVRGTSDGSGLLGVSTAGGGYGVYAESGGVGPFTGQHDALLLKEAELEPGDIVVDVKVVARSGIDDAVTEVARSSAPMQKTVVGVLSRRVPLEPDALLAAFPVARGCPDRIPKTLAEQRAHRRQRERDEKLRSTPSSVRLRLCQKYDRLTINSLGEGQINVCGLNGDIEAGDLIVTSAMPGKGQRQDDDLVRSCTVAKAREAVTFERSDQVKRIACIYLAG